MADKNLDMKTAILFLSTGLLCTASLNTLAAAPKLTGDFTTDITLGGVTNVAVDEGSIAQVIIGSIADETSMQGNFNATVSAGEITNTASGKNACAQVVISSLIGNTPCISTNGL